MKVASQQFRGMKTFPLFMLLFILIWLPLTGKLLYWQLFDAPFTGAETVAYLPWFGEPMPLNLFSWYVVCSFAAGILISRVFGLGMEATE